MSMTTVWEDWAVLPEGALLIARAVMVCVPLEKAVVSRVAL